MSRWRFQPGFRAHFMRRFGRSLIVGALASLSQIALASEYADAWGPSVGSKAPLLAANDQDGVQQTLASLSGPKGLLLVFNRSVDW